MGSAARSSYPPIAGYAYLSDGETAALVSHDGSIDWLCAPRFDGPSVFARILDLRGGGSLSLRPVAGDWQRARRYAPETNVLETTYSGPDGHAVVWDFMSLDMEGRHGPGEVYAHGNLIRLIECHAGAIELEARIAPRPEYARADPRYRRGRYGIDIVGGSQRLNARCDRRLEPIAVSAIAR